MMDLLIWAALCAGIAAAVAALYGHYRVLPGWLTGPEVCQLDQACARCCSTVHARPPWCAERALGCAQSDWRSVPSAGFRVAVPDDASRDRDEGSFEGLITRVLQSGSADGHVATACGCVLGCRALSSVETHRRSAGRSEESKNRRSEDHAEGWYDRRPASRQPESSRVTRAS